VPGADHRDVGDRRMTGQDVLDLGAVDVLPTRDDHIRLAVDDEAKFEEAWRRLGLSVDWGETPYVTIGPRAQRASQRAFLRQLARDEAYKAEAPTLWDVDDRTAVAQAELEDREMSGAYYGLRFHRDSGDDVIVETTRPELLPACVALVAHPTDERYQSLFGTEVVTPLFGARVPAVAQVIIIRI